MPQIDNSRGGRARTRRVRRKQPASRSDAAQRVGARTPPPPPTPKPAQRGHSSEGGRTIRPETVQRVRETAPSQRGKSDAAQGNSTRAAEERTRGKSDAAQGNGTRAAERFKRTERFQRAVTDARRAVIRRALRRHESIPKTKNTAVHGEEFDLRAELEGNGITARILSDVAEQVTKDRGKDKGGGGSLFAAAIPGLRFQPKPLRELTTRAAKDAINLPAQAIPSVYVPAAAAVEAAQGRPERGKQLLKDIDENDPVWNLGAAAVEALQGNTDKARERLERAGEAASEHPGFTAAEVWGLKGTAGRAAGSAGRSGVAGRKVKQAASTTRAPKTLPGTTLEEQRSYSPDVFDKGAQVANERRKARKAQKLRKRADATEDPQEAAELRAKANRTDPTRMQPHEVRKRVDERVAANEDIRRANRGRTLAEVDEIVKRVPPRQRPLISPIAQGIVKADRDSIRDYVKSLAAEHDRLDAAGKRANTQLRRELTHALEDPKLDLDAVRQAAQAFREHQAPGQRTLVERGLLDDEQATRARLVPYAVQHMNARHDGKRLVDAEGKTLSTADIQKHMAANGVDEPAFLTQAPNQRGARNFNIRSERAQTIVSRRRTGEATRAGTFDAHPDTLRESAARTQGLIDATDGFRGFVAEMAAKSSRGRARQFQTRTQAERAAANLEASTGERFRPVRINPWGASQEQLSRLMDEVNAEDQLAGSPGSRSAIVEAMDDALAGKGDGPYALIPEAAAQQLQAHLNRLSTGTAGKVFQQVNSAFRKTVLSTSPSWLAGNVVEGGMRTALAKGGPRAYLTGRRTVNALREMDPDAADALAVRALGGGHFSFADRAHVRRDAEQFAGTRVEPIANMLGKFWRTPGPKQAAGLWNRWTEFMFQQLNPRIERQFQTAMLGAAIRRADLIPEGMLKTSQKAAQEAAAGLRGTNAQVRFGRMVDRMYGRYGKLSPNERLVLAYYSPFLMWSQNAAYFVARTLPMDHPTTLAVIAASEAATEDWRESHGLDLWMDGAVPGFLQGSIPVDGDGGKLRASRYTPFGLFGDPLNSAAGLWLPQFSGVMDAFEGRDWSGRALREPYTVADREFRTKSEAEEYVRETGMNVPIEGGGPAGQDLRAKTAAISFLDATIPVLGVAKRVQEDGVDALNPFRVTRGLEDEEEDGPRGRSGMGSSSASSRPSSSSGFDLSGLGGSSRAPRSSRGYDLSGLGSGSRSSGGSSGFDLSGLD